MAVYVFLGHGGFDQKGTPGYPTEVLIPPDTSLKFYADAGQTLLLPNPSDTNPNSGYERVAPVFDQVKDRGSPLTATMTTYNYCLYPDDSEKYRQSARRADWRGATPVFLPAGERYLCQGTTQTCPTPALIASGSEADISNPERWKHNCTGILGEYGAKGNELHWLACASFEYAEKQLPATEMGAVSGPGAFPTRLDVVTDDWAPTTDELAKIRDVNQENVKDTNNKKEVAIAVGGVLVLIGEGHRPNPVGYVKRQNDFEEGVITVTKAGAFSKGTLAVKGISTRKRKLVEDTLEEFSEKKVTFA
jgi:hypothetical protein